MRLLDFVVGINYQSNRRSYRNTMRDLDGLIYTAERVRSVFQRSLKNTLDVSNYVTDLDRFAKIIGSTAQQVHNMGAVFEKQGGSVELLKEQLAVVDRFRNLKNVDTPAFLKRFGEAGFDPRVITRAKSTMEAYRNLLDYARSMKDPKRAKQLRELLGFGDNFLRLSQLSGDELDRQLAIEGRRLKINQTNIKNTREFVQAVIDGKNALKNAGIIIASKIAPHLVSIIGKLEKMDVVNDIASTLASAFELVDNNLELFLDLGKYAAVALALGKIASIVGGIAATYLQIKLFSDYIFNKGVFDDGYGTLKKRGRVKGGGRGGRGGGGLMRGAVAGTVAAAAAAGAFIKGAAGNVASKAGEKITKAIGLGRLDKYNPYTPTNLGTVFDPFPQSGLPQPAKKRKTASKKKETFKKNTATKRKTPTKRKVKIPKTGISFAGRTAGRAAGGVIGGLLGSVVPVAGTAVGSVIGATLADMAMSYAVDSLMDSLSGDSGSSSQGGIAGEPPVIELHNNIKLTLDGRVIEEKMEKLLIDTANVSQATITSMIKA